MTRQAVRPANPSGRWEIHRIELVSRASALRGAGPPAVCLIQSGIRAVHSRLYVPDDTGQR